MQTELQQPRLYSIVSFSLYCFLFLLFQERTLPLGDFLALVGGRPLYIMESGAMHCLVVKRTDLLLPHAAVS
jgi:hypothetical protein